MTRAEQGKIYPGLPLTHWIGRKEVDCKYNLIDDVVASGLTKRTAAWKLKKEGILLQRIIVLFDRQQGDGLLAEGFELHAIFHLTDVVDFLRANHLIHSKDHQKIVEFLHSKRFDLATRTKVMGGGENEPTGE